MAKARLIDIFPTGESDFEKYSGVPSRGHVVITRNDAEIDAANNLGFRSTTIRAAFVRDTRPDRVQNMPVVCLEIEDGQIIPFGSRAHSDSAANRITLAVTKKSRNLG